MIDLANGIFLAGIAVAIGIRLGFGRLANVFEDFLVQIYKDAHLSPKEEEEKE